jgi:hypothetical protein
VLLSWIKDTDEEGNPVYIYIYKDGNPSTKKYKAC